MTSTGRGIVRAAVAAAAVAALAVPATSSASRRADLQSTALISRSMDGKMPNGASTHPVISGDKRFARAIAFESDASNLVRGDKNGFKDVFAVLRAGHIDNLGARWIPGRTVMVSRTASGRPSNGPSFAPAIDGGFDRRPSCVAFLSSASNLVGGDTNGVDDAFVTRLSGANRKPRRLLPGGHQAVSPVTAVTVSQDCKAVAFVSGGKLYAKRGGGKPRLVQAPGVAADPSFSVGRRRDLVFGAAGGVYLLKQGARRPRLVAPGGSNPVYNDIVRQVVAYERPVGGHMQIAARDIGRGERIISSRGGDLGNGDSRDPVIGNTGHYITFETDATNLGVNANRRAGDDNGMPDVYLYTDVRKITLVQSVVEKALPMDRGGQHPAMSFYANYILFDATLPLNGPAADVLRTLVTPGAALGTPQIYMRYLGPV
ncbi:MAG: hypothetical protein QOC77_1888 [Thermoleophilaceae bacterium]|jgi:hypothetical protein|nr:hypothetical protein [Thermoleophilaceae bacterium]MEA2471871.1 hypothetical protein [Thermoleophilaceae bacterium]